jgi:hypothetical protein
MRHARSFPCLVGAVSAVCIGLAFWSPAANAASAPCWKAVIADWSENGSVDETYSLDCYRAAMQNAPTDLRIYSALEDDLQRALQVRASRKLAAGPPVAAAGPAASSSGSSSTILEAVIAGLALITAAVTASVVLTRRGWLRRRHHRP